MTPGNELFHEVLVACRLDPSVAPFTVRRLLLRVRVTDVDRLTPAQLALALPHCRTELPRLLQDAAEVARATTAIERLCLSEAAST
jgi:hypothetical protein